MVLHVATKFCNVIKLGDGQLLQGPPWLPTLGVVPRWAQNFCDPTTIFLHALCLW